jgi:predicted aldo/keto reductase-like oxidoreductase
MNDASVSRRGFICAGAAAAAAAALPRTANAEGQPEPKPAEPIVLPRRKLGRTGVDVTMLGQGAAFAIGARHLNVMHEMGVRYIDTAKYYLQGASERAIGEWLQGNGLRKEYFIVTKDVPMTPDQLATMVDERLELLKTDYIDMFFLHGLGDSDHYHGLEDARWFTDKEWTQAIEKVRKSGKCKFFGFSTHTEPVEVRTGMLEAAAKGGWVDGIMVAADPVLIRDNAEFNKALDACHKAGVGLISMKECRSQGDNEEARREDLAKKIESIFPKFKEKALSPFTAVLSAMWTDERFACLCSHMDNLEKLRENAAACKDFKPLAKDELAAVDFLIRNSRRTLCLACDGSCRRAGHTQADLNTIARYVCYAEQDGRVYEARELLAALPPEARDWSGADLEAASHACKSNLDFVQITKRAKELMA